jgi:membrane protein insertase Oxa1/YidC/SpoIIIJ
MLKMRAIMRSLAVLALPLTAHEPSGVFIYWLSNNAFSVTQVGYENEAPG